MIGSFVVVFGTLTWRQHTNYGTFGFDMGLHDQGIWLTSRLRDPFVTVRGMNYYGHHVNLVSILYAPLYWLGAGPRVLSLTQAMALATGAVPLYLLTRWRTGSPWIALVPAAAWLLHPSVEWISWWHWHPEAMAVTPLLFAWYFAVRQRWRWCTAAIVGALLCKEDVALAVAMFGVARLLWTRRDRRRAAETPAAAALPARLDRHRSGWRRPLAVTAGGVVWFALCTRVVIPAILGDSPFYERNLFPEFGDSLGSVLFGIVTRPDKVAALALAPDRLLYYAKLLLPFGALAPFAAPILLIAGPQVGVNVLSSLPGTYDIRFQYSAMVLVGVALASAEGLSRLVSWWQRTLAGRRDVVVRFGPGLLCSWVLIAALATNMAWSPSPIGAEFDSGIWARRIPRHDVFDRAIALVPAEASVAATYYLIPHLTHREEAYEWPNPWLQVNWGLSGEAVPDPSTVDYVVLDTTLAQEPDLLLDLTTGGAYEVLLDEDAVVVLRRADALDDR